MVQATEIATGQQQKPSSLWEKGFAVFAIVYGSTAFIRLLMSYDEYGAAGDENLSSPTKTIFWILIYSVAGFFLLKRRKAILPALKQSPVFLLLLGFISLSVLWSESKMISMLSIGALLGNSLVGFYFGLTYSVKQFLKLLGWAYGVIVVATLLSPILTLDYLTPDKQWLGFFAQKNATGTHATIGFLVFLVLSKIDVQSKLLYQSFCALSIALIFLSASATSVVTFVALVCILFLQKLLQKYFRSTWSRVLFTIGVLVCSIFFVMTNLDGLLTALGKNEDLSGRVTLWGMLVVMARDKFLLGYGYGGFWVYGGPAQAIWDVFPGGVADSSYAHNGYLQLLMDCGVIGVVLLVCLLVIILKNSWIYSMGSKNIWPLYFILLLLINNLAEATFAARNNVTWLILVTCMVQMQLVLSRNGLQMFQIKGALSRGLQLPSTQI